MPHKIRDKAGMFPHYRKMKEYGLIGHPLGHSFSKKFFTDKFCREGIDASYTNFDIPHASMLMDIIQEHPNLVGVNCTIPHKESVMQILDKITPEAQEIGAVNVIKIRRSKEHGTGTPERGFRLIGYNSDILGFKQSIAPLLKASHKNALILGTGGAAKAVAVGLRQLGLTYTNVSRKPKEDHLTYEDITTATMNKFQVIVNCTPVGMFPHTDEAPQLPYEALTPQHLLFDLIYNPEETLFLKKGKEQGAATQNGMDMLRLQALAAWDIWTK